jgi:hypothetical protein
VGTQDVGALFRIRGIFRNELQRVALLLGIGPIEAGNPQFGRS